MGATITIALLWAAFAGTHMGLSSPSVRQRLVGSLGEQGFQGVYSLVALAIFVPLAWLYSESKHTGPFLWYLGTGPLVRWPMYVGMALALSLFVAGFVTPSPASIGASPTEPRGLLRVTRHPVLMALGLYGLLHLLTARVNASELAFFGGFPIFVLLGAAHQDRRKLAGGDDDFRAFHANTAFLPFTGTGALRGLREAALPIGIGIALTVALRWLHPTLFGGVA